MRSLGRLVCLADPLARSILVGEVLPSRLRMGVTFVECFMLPSPGQKVVST